MKTEFQIKLKTGDMYRFLMYHAYHGASGIFSVVAGLALVLYYVLPVSSRTQNSWIYLLFGVLFLVYQPWTLYTNAVRQVKLNPAFQKPLHYAVSDEGIAVQQGESSAQAGWEQVTKVRETGRSIFVYTGKKNAYIWVKKQLGKQEAQVRALLEKHVPAQKRKLK